MEVSWNLYGDISYYGGYNDSIAPLWNIISYDIMVVYTEYKANKNIMRMKWEYNEICSQQYDVGAV